VGSGSPTRTCANTRIYRGAAATWINNQQQWEGLFMAIADTAAAVARQPADNRQMINAIIASVLGWALDLFDLFILLYVAPVLGALFFPSNDTTLSLAAVYASYSVITPISTAARARC
jgi:hypothetical protein